MSDLYSASQALRDPNLFTSSALTLLADRFGTEFIEWDPLTISMELNTEFGIEASQDLLDKIQAGCSLYTSNLFFLSLEAFNTICNSLNFGVSTGEMFLPADLDDVLWGVTEAAVILGPEDFKAETFSHNIASYVGALLEEAGIMRPPAGLAFAEYSEDPDLRSEDVFEGDESLRMAYWKNQEQEKEMLDKQNHAKLMALMIQLTRLPLINGSADPIRKTLNKMLRAS